VSHPLTQPSPSGPSSFRQSQRAPEGGTIRRAASPKFRRRRQRARKLNVAHIGSILAWGIFADQGCVREVAPHTLIDRASALTNRDDRSQSFPGVALGFGVEVLEAPGGDAGVFEEHVEVGCRDPQHPPHLVGGDVALVNEPIQRALGDAEPLGGVRRPSHRSRQRTSDRLRRAGTVGQRRPRAG